MKRIILSLLLACVAHATDIDGNAGTATALQTPRTINGVSFAGTGNITVTAAAGTLTGSTLASGVTASSLTSAAGGNFGTAAFTAASAYSTAAQGALAATALQPNGSAASLTNFPTLNQSTTGSAATLTTPRTINGVSFNGSANITVTAAGSTLSDPVSFANGANTGSAATSATTGTMTVNMTTSIVTITPTNACTFNATGGVTGQICTFVITTSGVSSFVLTWGTNYKTTATLATGTTTARTFCVTFRYTGAAWVEIARTTAMA